MFTGLVEEKGVVQWLRQTADGTQLQIKTGNIAKNLKKGDSLAVNGCCLTVRSHRAGYVTFDLLEETLERTNLRLLRPDGRVNLERPMAADGRFGGHMVQGHVDCTAEVISWEQQGDDYRLEIRLPEEFSHYVAYKGSIAVSGISLTVAEVNDSSGTLVIWIIPHTRDVTNLKRLQVGDVVNLEFDIIAKYVERMLTRVQQA